MPQLLLPVVHRRPESTPEAFKNHFRTVHNYCVGMPERESRLSGDQHSQIKCPKTTRHRDVLCAGRCSQHPSTASCNHPLPRFRRLNAQDVIPAPLANPSLPPLPHGCELHPPHMPFAGSMNRPNSATAQRQPVSAGVNAFGGWSTFGRFVTGSAVQTISQYAASQKGGCLGQHGPSTVGRLHRRRTHARRRSAATARLRPVHSARLPVDSPLCQVLNNHWSDPARFNTTPVIGWLTHPHRMCHSGSQDRGTHPHQTLSPPTWAYDSEGFGTCWQP